MCMYVLDLARRWGRLGLVSEVLLGEGSETAFLVVAFARRLVSVSGDGFS